MWSVRESAWVEVASVRGDWGSVPVRGGFCFCNRGSVRKRGVASIRGVTSVRGVAPVRGLASVRARDSIRKRGSICKRGGGEGGVRRC